MSSDRIIGISVLQPYAEVPGVYRLWFDAQKASSEINQGWIHIAEKGAPNIPAKYPNEPDNINAIWRFTYLTPRLLDCAPSVNWISWGFHNAGQWQIEFIELVDVLPRHEDESDKCSGSKVHYEINRCLQTPEQREQYIAELIAAGKCKAR